MASHLTTQAASNSNNKCVVIKIVLVKLDSFAVHGALARSPHLVNLCHHISCLVSQKVNQ